MEQLYFESKLKANARLTSPNQTSGPRLWSVCKVRQVSRRASLSTRRRALSSSFQRFLSSALCAGSICEYRRRTRYFFGLLQKEAVKGDDNKINLPHRNVRFVTPIHFLAPSVYVHGASIGAQSAL